VDSSGVATGSSSAVLATGPAGSAKVLKVFEPPPGTDISAPLWGLALRVQVDDGRPRYDLRLATVTRPEPPGRARASG